MTFEPDNPEVMIPLNTLIDRATMERKWLFHGGLSGPLWFSPQELREENKRGKFRWSPVNWELRDPTEYLAHAHAKLKTAKSEVDAITRRIATWRASA